MLKTDNKKIVKISITIILGALYFALLYWRFSMMPIDSDYSNLILEADDVIHGNILRNGWRLTGVSFLTTDLLYFMLGTAIFGVSVRAYIFAGAFMYFVAVLVGYWLMNRAFTCNFFDKVFYCILALVPGYATVYMSRAHTGSVIFTMLALGLMIDKEKAKWLAIPLIILAAMGDMVGLVTVIIPFILVRIAEWIKEGNLKKYLFDILASSTAILIGLVLCKLYYRLGTCYENSYFGIKGFDKAEHIGDKLALYIKILLSVFNADYSSYVLLGGATIRFIVGAVFILIALLAAVVQIIRFVKGQDYDLIAITLVVGELIIFLVCLTTSIFSNVVCGRYIGTMCIVSAIVIVRSRLLQTFSAWDNIRMKLLIIAIGLVYMLGCFRKTNFDYVAQVTQYDELEMLKEALEAEGLENGYGSFWCASALTVYSGNEIKVRAAINQYEHFMPYDWFTKTEWYEKPANFVVNDKETMYDWFDLTYVADRLGPPVKTINVGRYDIFIYDYDITSNMYCDWAGE